MLEEVRETHEVRYFFPQEIVHYLEEAAFEVLQMSPFPDLRGPSMRLPGMRLP